jgi:hypothetical protein
MSLLKNIILFAAPICVNSLGHNCDSVKELFKADNCCDSPGTQLAPRMKMDEKIVVMFKIIVNNNEVANALYPALNAGWMLGQYTPKGEYTIAYTTDPDCELCTMQGTNIHFMNNMESAVEWVKSFENLDVATIGAFCEAFRWPEVRVIGPGVGADSFKELWYYTLRRWRDVCPKETHPALYYGGTVFLGTSQNQTVLPPNMF